MPKAVQKCFMYGTSTCSNHRIYQVSVTVTAENNFHFSGNMTMFMTYAMRITLLTITILACIHLNSLRNNTWELFIFRMLYNTFIKEVMCGKVNEIDTTLLRYLQP